MTVDEYGRPTMSGVGTGPREVALYLADSTKPPIIPPHVQLLEAQIMAAGRSS